MNVHRLLVWSGLSAVLSSAVACQDSDDGPTPAGPAPVNCTFHGRVQKDATLYKACSPYTMKGGVDVLDDATLTIEAGVEVRFSNNDWLEIAAAGTRGARLVARGTQAEPIILTWIPTKKTSAQRFLGLWFNGGTRSGSVLANAIIRRGGGDNRILTPALVQGCVTVTDVADGNITIENVQLEGCTNAGVVLKGSRPNLAGLTLKDMTVGFLLDGVAPDIVPASVTYDNVAQNVVEGPATRPVPASRK